MSDDFNFDFDFDDAVEMSLDDVEAVGKKQITKDAAIKLKAFITFLRDKAPYMKDAEGNELPTHVGVPIVWNRLPKEIRDAFNPERKEQRVTGGFASIVRYVRSWQDDLNVFPKAITDDNVIHALLNQYSNAEEGLTDLDVAQEDQNLLYGGFILVRKNEWKDRIAAKKASQKKDASSDATPTDEPAETPAEDESDETSDDSSDE